MTRQSFVTAAFVIGLSVGIPLAAQTPTAPPAPSQPPRALRTGPPGRRGPGSAADVQRLFEAYVLMQSQQALGITDAAYPQFLAKMKALLDLRQQTQQKRAALVRDLRQLTVQNTPAASDAELGDALKRLKDFDATSAADLEKATAALDGVLDVRQQAKLRVFEEQMERRKLDLLMRARAFRGKLNPE
jgi:hypothetical protein